MMGSEPECSKQSFPCGQQCIPKLLHCGGSCTEGYISCGSLCLEEEFHWKCGEVCLYHEEPCENSCPKNYILCGTECVDIKSVERDIEWFENSCKYGAANNQWIFHSVLFILLISIIKKYLWWNTSLYFKGINNYYLIYFYFPNINKCKMP